MTNGEDRLTSILDRLFEATGCTAPADRIDMAEHLFTGMADLAEEWEQGEKAALLRQLAQDTIELRKEAPRYAVRITLHYTSNTRESMVLIGGLDGQYRLCSQEMHGHAHEVADSNKLILYPCLLSEDISPGMEQNQQSYLMEWGNEDLTKSSLHFQRRPMAVAQEVIRKDVTDGEAQHWHYTISRIETLLDGQLLPDHAGLSTV